MEDERYGKNKKVFVKFNGDDGELEAYESGSVVIKAKVHGKTFTCSVTVTDTASEYDNSSNFVEQEY